MLSSLPVTALSMSQTKEELLRHLGMDNEIYALMAVSNPCRGGTRHRPCCLVGVPVLEIA